MQLLKPNPRSSLAPRAAMRLRSRRTRLAWRLALVVLVGCSVQTGEAGGPLPTASAEGAETIDVEYGAVEPRIVALDAFTGRRTPITLRMSRHSVEGRVIRYELAVTAGNAVLSVDERADGGGVRQYTLAALQLVRHEPARWAGNVEVEKDGFVAVDRAAARATPGVYVLVHPKCLTEPCAEVF